IALVDPAPPSEAREGAWQRAAEELGAAEPEGAPQSSPFTTATATRPPPLSSPPLTSLSPPAHGLRSAAAWSWLRRLAPVAVALLGGLVAGSALQRRVTSSAAAPQALVTAGLVRSSLTVDSREAPT